MNKVMLLYPPGKAYQRGEDRAQCNLEQSAVVTAHACNDIGYAASVLRMHGHSVMLRDYQTERAAFEDVKSDALCFCPDVIVISVTNATIYDDIKFVNTLAQFCKCKYILKGAVFYNTAISLLESLDLQNVDFLIGGEIDTVIGDLADRIEENEGLYDDIDCIYYKQDGTFRKTRFDVWVDDLDAIPFPARDLMKNELYLRPDTGETMATIQVARGCPAGCTYCLTPVISGKKIRKRSIENVFAEIEECYYKYNIRNFFFRADTFTFDPQWAMALCDRIINSELCGKIEFTVNSRAKPLDSDLLQKLKKAGCFMIAVGFESGNDETLKKIGKGITKEDNLRAAMLIKQAKLPSFGFFMIGFPWETKEDIVKTMQFMFEVDSDFIEVHIAMPYYGTRLYEQCLEYNTINAQAWGNDYFSPNTIGTQSVPMEEIIRIRDSYVLRYYLRPKYIVGKMLECIKRPKAFLNYVKHGMKLLRNTFLQA